MLVDGLKISWRLFRNGFIHNLAILFILIISNAAILTILVIDSRQNPIIIGMVALSGYVLVIALATYAAKFRMKEVLIRKLLGAQFIQIYALTAIDTIIYMTTSLVFSVIIVEHIHERNEALIALNLMAVIKYLAILITISLMISIIPALKLNTHNPQKL